MRVSVIIFIALTLLGCNGTVVRNDPKSEGKLVNTIVNFDDLDQYVKVNGRLDASPDGLGFFGREDYFNCKSDKGDVLIKDEISILFHDVYNYKVKTESDRLLVYLSREEIFVFWWDWSIKPSKCEPVSIPLMNSEEQTIYISFSGNKSKGTDKNHPADGLEWYYIK